MKTNCSRCGGQDGTCYVCKPEPEAAKEWPTREEVEELCEQAQIVLDNRLSGLQGVRASACIEDGELVFQVSGYNKGNGTFLTGSGLTEFEAIEHLEKAVEKDDPAGKLEEQANKLGLTLTKIKP